MARPRINPDHDPIKARDELAKAVAEVYLHPESDMEKDENDHATMKELREQFGLTMTKIRKLLVTAGVYRFEKDGVDLVQEVQRLAAEGKTLEEIKNILNISTGTANSFLPYKSGTYNADFTADGYDYSNVSTDARRKRNQRKRENMKEESVLKERKERIEDMEDKRTYMDKKKEQEKTEKNNARESSRLWLQKYGFENQTGVYERIVNAVKEGKIDVTDIPGVLEYSSDEEINEMREDAVAHIFSYVTYLYSFIIPDEPETDPGVKTLGDRVKSHRYIHGKKLGDYIFLPGEDELYKLPSGEMVDSSKASLTGFIDQNKEKHVFVLTGWTTGTKQVYRHIEVFRVNKNGKRYAGQPETEYEFSVVCHVDDESGVYKLIEKTAISLQNLTLERETNRGHSGDRQLVDGKYVYRAKEVGTISVLDDYDGTVYFQVDGKRYDPKDLPKLFSTYVGGNLIYQEVDSCDDPIEEDMMLIPMRVDEDTLEQELKDLLFAMTVKHEGKYLKKEDMAAFDVLFKKIVEKLGRYFGGNPRDVGKAAGDKLIKVLKGIGTDDNMFPEYEIKMVQDAIRDPWEE